MSKPLVLKNAVWASTLIAAVTWTMGIGAALSLAAESPRLLDDALKGPMAGVEEIVFAVRAPGMDHWYVNFGYYADGPNHKGYREGGRLCRLNLRTGKLTVLLDDPRATRLIKMEFEWDRGNIEAVE
jgi:hypothetical protein